MSWEPAERVQKNSAGEFRALIGGEWVSVPKAQKNSTGEYRVWRERETQSPEQLAAGIASDPISQGARQAIEEKPAGYDIARQLGLTARAGISGVTALPAMVGDALGMNSTGAVNRLMNAVNLPQPANSMERVAQDVAGGLASTGGIAALAGRVAPQVSSLAGRKIAELLASNVGTQTAATMGGAAAGGIAREEGAGPAGQLAASLAGGIAPALARPILAKAGNAIGDTAATVGASFGNRRAIDRIARDAVQSEAISGDAATQQKIRNAIANRTEYVPGASPTVAESIAEANMGKPGMFGGATMKLQKDLSGTKGIEDILPGYGRTQKDALAKYAKEVKAKAAPIREQAFDDMRANGGVNTSLIEQGIDSASFIPGDRATPFVKNSLQLIKQRISELQGYPNNVDPEDLYSVRKQIGNIIKGASKESSTWDKKQAARIDRGVQLLIDDAMVPAGGTRWKEYLNTYASGLRNIDDVIARQKELKDMAKQVKGVNAGNLVKGEVPQIPNLLSRPAMLINFAIRRVVGDANTPVAKRIAEAMTNPQEYAKLMSAPASDPMRVLLERALRQAATAEAASPRQETAPQ